MLNMSANQYEIISGEVFLDSIGTNIEPSQNDTRLEAINDRLQSYRCDASFEDYALAVLSGILSGAIDAFILQEAVVARDDISLFPSQVMEGLHSGKMTNARSVSHARVDPSLLTWFPGLDKWAGKPTPVGFVTSMLSQFSRSGILTWKDNKMHIIPEGIDRTRGCLLFGLATALGAMNWLVEVSDIQSDATAPLTGLSKIGKLIRNNPKLVDIVKGLDQWQTQLAGEMKGYQKAKGKPMGSDEILGSMLTALDRIPVLQGSRLSEFMKHYGMARTCGITDIPLLKALTRQAMPVLLNEVLVRTLYLVMRLAAELDAHEDVSDIDWNKILPMGNRTIDRMLTIASITFNVADTVDAAVHAAVSSAGNYVLFSTQFVKRFNYVGAARAGFAVFREIFYEKEEAELLREKRLLTEARTSQVIEQLTAYRQQIEAKVSEYLAEDITAFLTGIDLMDQGLVSGDTESVNRGNVIIQRVLGREPQFTSQDEFDALMDSDIPLQL